MLYESVFNGFNTIKIGDADSGNDIKNKSSVNKPFPLIWPRYPWCVLIGLSVSHPLPVCLCAVSCAGA